LKYSISLAKRLRAKLYVIHVSEFFNYKVPVLKRDKLINKINEKIARIADESKFKIEKIIYEIGEPAQKIIEVAKKNKVDLIPMAIHQRKGIEKFFLGSISEKVLMYSDIPVLILPPSNYELP
jgi:nucleotide-binding universal stress UspA family protein